MSKITNSKSTPVPSKSNDFLDRMNNLNNSLETFTEYFVYDAEMEQYISLNDAFYNGNVLNEPVRVRDPTTGTYILLKDAIIKGLISTHKNSSQVDFKNKSTFTTFQRMSYIVDFVLDPRKKTKFSFQEASRRGLLVNGIYKHPYKDSSFSLDDAISSGFVIGKKVDLAKIEETFKTWLTLPPTKPTRGVFVSEKTENKHIKSASTNNFQAQNSKYDNDDATDLTTSTSSKTKHPRKRTFTSEESIVRSNIQPISGKISLIKDVANDKYLKLNDAERYGLINFMKGIFKNSLTKETIQINEAIDKGYILLSEKNTSASHQDFSEKSLNDTRKSSLSIKQIDSFDDLDNENRIEVDQQFEILSITDVATKKSYDLESAIGLGVFDSETATYVNKLTNERLSLIEAIDQGLVSITDKTFKTSYKLELDKVDKRTNKKISHSIRYVVDPLTQDIVPVNVAYSKKLVDLDDGYYIDYTKLTLKEAYQRCLILTKEDLDNPDSERARFNVVLARKSTNGKNMSVKSALAKNWLNIGRRVYIDKQTNEEIPFSQAVDMDLLVLRYVNLNFNEIKFHAKKIGDEIAKSKLIR